MFTKLLSTSKFNDLFKLFNMAILLPRKLTLICMLVLGPICVVHGIVQKDTEEILAMLAVLILP
ncbi:hypothetical protein [Mucilaginibacter sp. UYCu711]|uniref:hypothetical protein n=1 Tax=Mucilaginibacter sp. UYCu711 TaxID=3156339 RepID=UPI003D25DD80